MSQKNNNTRDDDDDDVTVFFSVFFTSRRFSSNHSIRERAFLFKSILHPLLCVMMMCTVVIISFLSFLPNAKTEEEEEKERERERERERELPLWCRRPFTLTVKLYNSKKVSTQ